MTRGRNWTPAERAIIYAGAIGGLSLERVNELLASAQSTSPRSLPAVSYDWIKRSYVPRFATEPALLGECIEHPRPDGDLG
jgi:hypothetical protein